MAGSIRHLDDTILECLKSQISLKALELLNEIIKRHAVKFMDYRTHPNISATAYTQIIDEVYIMWLNPEEDEIADTFVHEIGQIYTHTLGYQKEARAKFSKGIHGDLANKLTGMTINTFRGPITERHLEKYGIDRSHYRRRRYDGFKNILSKIPDMEAIEKDEMSRLFHWTQLCYQYNLTRLLLLDEFGELERLWTEKISSDAIKKAAAQIFVTASQTDLTPLRYVKVQKHFIQTLRLQVYVKI